MNAVHKGDGCGAHGCWLLVLDMEVASYRVSGLGNMMRRQYDLCIYSDVGLSESKSHTTLPKRDVM